MPIVCGMCSDTPMLICHDRQHDYAVVISDILVDDDCVYLPSPGANRMGERKILLKDIIVECRD